MTELKNLLSVIIILLNHLRTKKIVKLFYLAIFAFILSACESSELIDLRTNFNITENIPPEKDFSVMDSASGKLNYVRTLYTAWKFKSNNPYINSQASNSPHNSLDWYSISIMLQGFAATGDQQNVLRYTPFEAAEVKEKMTPKLEPAHEYILDNIKDNRVVMFNEAHDRIQCRVFFLEMLEDFRKAGFTHLAMESLNNLSINADQLHYQSYLYEPVYAQIIRKAKKLGFTLVAYEDTSTINKEDNREKWQALNLYLKIKNGKSFQKTLVLAGYQHISEDSLAENKSMASYFAMISKINPLTIDQTVLIEKPPANPTLRQIIDASNKNEISSPVVIERVDLQSPDIDINEHILYNVCDLYVYHPATKYVNQRPDWLLTKNKKIQAIKIPEDAKPVLAQAYLSAEIKSDVDYDFKIPVDQAFYVDEQSVHFILEKNSDYNIVFRDQANRIISKKLISTGQ